MAPLPAPFDEDDWGAEIAEEARTEFRGSIVIEKPGKPGVWDPKTQTFDDSGTPATEIIPERPARIQPYNQAIANSDGNGYTVRRRIRFQQDILPDDPIIKKGSVVRVIDGGRDHTLASFVYPVISAINSSSAAQRTIETSTEGTTVA
jgi:hypothetical protein